MTTKEEYLKVSKNILNTAPNEMIRKNKRRVNMENTVITIFDDGEENYVLWDTKNGSVKTKDGQWLNPDPGSDERGVNPPAPIPSCMLNPDPGSDERETIGTKTLVNLEWVVERTESLLGEVENKIQSVCKNPNEIPSEEDNVATIPHYFSKIRAQINQLHNINNRLERLLSVIEL